MYILYYIVSVDFGGVLARALTQMIEMPATKQHRQCAMYLHIRNHIHICTSIYIYIYLAWQTKTKVFEWFFLDLDLWLLDGF